MLMTFRKITTSLFLLPALLFTLAAALPATAAPVKNTQKSFTSPEDALKVLVKAVRSNDAKSMLAILGPGAKEIISSGDPVADKTARERFVRLYDEKVVI